MDAPPGDRPIFGSARLTEAEVREAMAASPAMKARWVGLLVGVGLSVFMTKHEGRNLGDPFQLVSMVLVMAVLAIMLLLAPRKMARKMLVDMKADQGDFSYRFDAEGITIRAPGTSGSASWRIINRWKETPLTFLVYASPGLAKVIPKKAFSAADVDAVRALLVAKVRPAEEGKR